MALVSSLPLQIAKPLPVMPEHPDACSLEDMYAADWEDPPPPLIPDNDEFDSESWEVC